MATAAVSGTSENYYVSSTKENEAAASTSSDGTLSHDDFLQLLMMQLSNQDPLSPMQDTEFMGQMAQFQALDEQLDMTNELKSLRTENQLQAASAMIGKHVTGVDGSDNEISGEAVRAIMQDGSAYIQFENLQKIPIENVTEVRDLTYEELMS